MMHKLYELEEKLCKELEEQSGRELSKGSLEVIDLLSHSLKSIAAYVAMKEAEEGGSYNSYNGSYNGGSVYDNRSFRRGSYDGGSYDGSYDDRGGNSFRRRRDSMGRYSSGSYDDGYSREGEHEQFKQQLHELMQQAPSGTIRQELQKIASQAGQM